MKILLFEFCDNFGIQMVLKKVLKRMHRLRVSLQNDCMWGTFGKRSKVVRPMRIIGKRFIHIGSNSVIMHDARIEAVYLYGKEIFTPCIRIGDNVDIQQRVHITCAESITIGNNVSVLPDVLITDINHPYEDITIPPKIQSLKHDPVSIGDETIIGMGARILPGVRIGKHCCIGTNAVVTKDIPDYSLAVGIPAVVVKEFNFEKREWCKTGDKFSSMHRYIDNSGDGGG